MTLLAPELIVSNYRKLREDILQAAKACGREGCDIKLVIASKNQPIEHLLPLLDAGHKFFGENRVQDAQVKWPELKERYPDIELHLIGPLQTNKVQAAIALFDVIESLDREKLARRLAQEYAKVRRRPKLFIQVNTGDEEQKAGVAPQAARDLIVLCRDELNLAIEGLMCIPPQDEEASMHFALLHSLARQNHLKNISMGMSGDFATAIALGATHVRIGSAIFGPREN